MTTSIIPLTGSPVKDWSCISCHKQGEPHDLITHTGYDPITRTDCRKHCIFHRMCFFKSESAGTGNCQRCGMRLHEYRVISDDVASVADPWHGLRRPARTKDATAVVEHMSKLDLDSDDSK